MGKTLGYNNDDDNRRIMECPHCNQINRFRYYNSSSYRLKCGKCGSLLAEIEMEDTTAVIISCDTTQKGLDLNECDSDIVYHYWIYEYEYRVPGKDEIRKHTDKVQFTASVFGRWFEKYHEGTRFPIRYDKADPTRHIRLDDFEIEEQIEIKNKSDLLQKYIKIEKKKHGVQILVSKIERNDIHSPVSHWENAGYFSGGASEAEIQEAVHRILENRSLFRMCIKCGEYQPNGLLYRSFCQKCAKRKLKSLRHMKIENNNDFKMKFSGYSGTIVHTSDDCMIEIEWRMSEASDKDIVLVPVDVRKWDEPKGTGIPVDKQVQILRKLRSWLSEQNLQTDIDLPATDNDLPAEDRIPDLIFKYPCDYPGCNKKKKYSSYCDTHYDMKLMKK